MCSPPTSRRLATSCSPVLLYQPAAQQRLQRQPGQEPEAASRLRTVALQVDAANRTLSRVLRVDCARLQIGQRRRRGGDVLREDADAAPGAGHMSVRVLCVRGSAAPMLQETPEPQGLAGAPRKELLR